MIWTDKPLYALDCESTSTDPETARIITVCLGYSGMRGQFGADSWLINPGVPIPAEATKVHGITDETASVGDDPAEALEDLRLLLDGIAHRRAPVVIHNAPYDLTLLDREFRRHLGTGLPEGLIVLDTLVLFRRFDLTTGSRTLEQLAAREGIRFPAHDAEADALASLRLLHILAARNDLLPHVDTQTLHRLQAGWYHAQVLAAHYRRAGNGDATTQPSTSWPYIVAEVTS